MTVRRKYILLIECFAKKFYSKEKDRLGNRNGKYINMEVELAAGCLLEEIHDKVSENLIDKIDDPSTIYLRSLDYGDVYLACLRSEVDELTTFETDVLYSVKPYAERLRLYMYDTCLDDCEQLKVGDAVLVEIDERSHHGVLKYKGPVPERSVEGIWFGVELKVSHPDELLSDSLNEDLADTSTSFIKIYKALADIKMATMLHTSGESVVTSLQTAGKLHTSRSVCRCDITSDFTCAPGFGPVCRHRGLPKGKACNRGVTPS